MEDYGFKYVPQLTSDEISALAMYKGETSVGINCILNDGYDTEKSYTWNDSPHPFASLGMEEPKEILDIICNLYSAIYKMSKQRDAERCREKKLYVYRGTTTDEVHRLSKSDTINKFLSTTYSESIAKRKICFALEKSSCNAHKCIRGCSFYKV